MMDWMVHHLVTLTHQPMKTDKLNQITGLTIYVRNRTSGHRLSPGSSDEV